MQPFGHGRRSCPGKRFVELELLVLLVEVVRNFRLEWAAPDDKTIEPEFKIFSRVDKELAIRFVDV